METDARVMQSAGWRGTRAALVAPVAAKHHLTYDDAILLLICWIVYVWLILSCP